MSGTDGFPSVPAAEPEPWRADIHRFWRTTVPAVVVPAVFAGAWWLTGELIGAAVVGTSLVVAAAVLGVWRLVWDHQDRLHSHDVRLTRVERQTAEQHLSVLAVSERQRNHELDCGRDELARRRATRETS